ncbi:MAG: phosphoenolpyruvate--protein phosphotransferase [Lentisphaeria bacterium]|nr:phosphoenolpyruvate--protein phosphotransferase [Lentisphaeria bacterium]
MAAQEKIFEVTPISPGIAIGKTITIGGSHLVEQVQERYISADDTTSEIGRFHNVLAQTKNSLRELKDRLKDKLSSGDAEIFDTHLMILEDMMLVNDIENLIRKDLKCAELAVYEASERYVKALEEISDPYLRERAADVRDVRSRVLEHFHKNEGKSLADNIVDRRIVIADELTPSETAHLSADKVLGFAVCVGSPTSHTAILARSMRMPAIVGMPQEMLNIDPSTEIIVDGFAGRLIVSPTERTLDAYRLKAQEANKFYSSLLEESELHAETRDGFIVQLGGNIEKLEDVSELKKFGGEAVGLFRSEITFLASPNPPSEEEQFELYKNLLSSMDGKMVVVRTLDIGGDKLNDGIFHHHEQNPFLGLRGIRLCLKARQDLFRTQLRALLRAGVYGDLKIMLPMLTSVHEIVEVRNLVEELKNELKKEKLNFTPKVSIGAMIETPASALLVDHIAPLVDFLSIGTNDLVQYTMAIDRSNDLVTYLYQPANPAILELIGRTVIAAKENNIWVSVCGQMASDPLYTPLLVGLGVNELSMDPASLSIIRRVIRSLKMSDAEFLASEALKCKSSVDVRKMSMELLRKTVPEIADIIIMQNER